ncbi:MAG: LysR substrate-binding domain-containing protein [Hyphomicrobiales bacterium]
MNKQIDAPVNFNVLALELDLLRTFTAIVDTGSFKGAAELVLRTPSAISMQVKKLEDIVGRPLFIRDARSVNLTQDGEVLLAYARRLLSLSDEALGHFRKPQMEGVVSLGAPDDYGSRFLPSILKRFAVTHPGVVVDVVIDLSVNLRERVKKGKLDLTLITCNGIATGDPDVEVVLEEQLVWAGAKGGCAHLKDPLPVSMWEEGCAWRSNATGELTKIGRDYRVAYMSAHSSGQKAAVSADLAIAPFPRSLVEHPLVALGTEDGLPELNRYSIGMLQASKSGDAVLAVASHIRSAFEEHQARI